MVEYVPETPIKIDVYSDAGFLPGQIARLNDEPLTSFADIKTYADDTKSKTTFKGEPAHFQVNLHFYNYASKVMFNNENNSWVCVFNVFADQIIIDKVTEVING